MKKFLLQIMFIVLVLPGMSQTVVSITGTITDTANNSPIPNHAVDIISDSSFGFVYYNTVYTDLNGFYSDTVPVPSGSSGTLFIQTFDCNYILHQATVNYTPANLNFTQDFQICNSNSPCQADFSYYISGYLTAQFIDYSTGGNGPWNWNFGDGGTSTNQNPSHIYSNPGQYYVTLAFGDPNTSCYDTKSMTIYLNDSTGGGCNAAFTVVPDSVNTPPYTYQFIDQSTGNIATWTWSFGDGYTQTISFPASPNVIHTYSEPGIYSACLFIQGVDSSCFDYTCDTIFAGSNTGCQANFYSFPDSSNIYEIHFIDQSLGNIISWAWNFGDGSPVGAGQNPVHVYAAPGSYTVCLTIHGADSSCYDITCKTVIVGNNTGCQAMFTYNNNPAYGAYAIQFTDQSTGSLLSWVWNFGDSTFSTEQNPLHVYTEPGTYLACLTITANNGTYCTSTYCQNVVVQDSMAYHQIYGQVFADNVPLQLGLAMIFSLDSNLNYNPYIDVCNIDSMGFYHFNTVPDGNYLVYAIPFDSNGYLPTYYGDVLNWSEATVIVLGEPSNPYNIHLIQSAYMPQGPGSVTGQINMGSMRISMLDKMIMLLLDENGNAISFVKVSESGSFDFSAMAYGTYYLHAEISGITSDNIQVVLSPEKPHADVVMTFAGKNILGITNMNPGLEAGMIYPNPVVNKLNVTLNLTDEVTVKVEIFNQMGQMVSGMVRSMGSGKSLLTLPVSNLVSGLYTIRISTDKGNNITRKLIITK
jgi:PKD repeat protein